MELTDLTKELITPISDSSPCGEDPKYNAEFEFVKAEITKDSGRDYEAIAENCATIIKSQAKDLTTLSYYLLASAKSGSIEDFSSVAVAYFQLAKEHWDDIHPKRERARTNAMKWLNEDHVVALLEQVTVQPANHEALVAAKEAFDGIKELTFEKFPNNPPSIKAIIGHVEGWVKKTKVAEAPKVVAPAPTAAPVASAAPVVSASASSAAPAPSGDATSVTEAAKSLQKLALFYIENSADSLIGYTLLRMNKWQALSVEPKNEGGKTMLKGPIEQRRSFFENQVSQSAWNVILEKSEPAFTEPGLMYWFDLQNYVCKALRATGKERIAVAIEWELSQLVERFPKIVDLKFSDELPFASAQTKEWIDELSFGGGGGGEGAKSSAVKDVDLGADLEQVKGMVSKQKFEDALFLLQSGMVFSTPKQKAERSIEMARVCFQGGMSLVAEPILEELANTIEERQLFSWDIDFCLDVWELSLKNLDSLLSTTKDDQENEILTKKRNKIFKSISRLSPSKAIKFSNPN